MCSYSRIYLHVQGKDYEARANALKNVVKTMLCREINVLSTLKLVDELQRLGIAYQFEIEISNVLEKIYDTCYKTQDKWEGMDLNLKALGFRLLRQVGYHVSEGT